MCELEKVDLEQKINHRLHGWNGLGFGMGSCEFFEVGVMRVDPLLVLETEERDG